MCSQDARPIPSEPNAPNPDNTGRSSNQALAGTRHRDDHSRQQLCQARIWTPAVKVPSASSVRMARLVASASIIR